MLLAGRACERRAFTRGAGHDTILHAHTMGVTQGSLTPISLSARATCVERGGGVRGYLLYDNFTVRGLWGPARGSSNPLRTRLPTESLSSPLLSLSCLESGRALQQLGLAHQRDTAGRPVSSHEHRSPHDADFLPLRQPSAGLASSRATAAAASHRS